MLKKLFTVDGFAEAYIGYTGGDRWNGWDCPYFEVAEALEIMKEFNKCAEFPMFYDKITDSFCIDNTEDKIFEEWKGTNYETEEGVKHLYGIGANSWVWDAINEGDLLTIAQKVEDFIYEFDTYEYHNNYDNRETVIEEIKAQLKDFNILKQTLGIFYNEDLTKEEIFDGLGGILKI